MQKLVEDAENRRTSAGRTRNALLSISFLGLGGCLGAERPPEPAALSAQDMIVLQTRVLDCEMRAANKVDDKHASISDVAAQIMGMCTVERYSTRRAFHLRIDDPDLDSDELKSAVDVVEKERRS